MPHTQISLCQASLTPLVLHYFMGFGSYATYGFSCARTPGVSAWHKLLGPLCTAAHLEVCQVWHHEVWQPLLAQHKRPCTITGVTLCVSAASAPAALQPAPLLVLVPTDNTPLPL